MLSGRRINNMMHRVTTDIIKMNNSSLDIRELAELVPHDWIPIIELINHVDTYYYEDNIGKHWRVQGYITHDDLPVFGDWVNKHPRCNRTMYTKISPEGNVEIYSLCVPFKK